MTQRLYQPDAAAIYLGMSRRSFDAIAAPELPYIALGSRKRFDRADLDGEQTIQLRESTRCGSLTDAIATLNRRIEEVTRPLYVQTAPGERTFAEAAAEYIADLERRGKSSERQIDALQLVMPDIEALPLRRIHQRTLQTWIDGQQGLRASGTVSRTLRTISTVLHYAATVLMDDDGEPWLKRVPPKLRAPDWGARQPRPISWEEQDRLVEHLPSHLIAPVLFAVATGARQAEVTSLRWDQALSLIHISQGIVR